MRQAQLLQQYLLRRALAGGASVTRDPLSDPTVARHLYSC